MSSKKNKGRLYKPSDGGKGSAPRVNVHSKQYRDNWDLIFGGNNANKENESKSTVNKAGNYTKPTMRKRLFERLKPVLKVVKPVSGLLEKPSSLQKNTKPKGEAISRRR